MPSTKVIFKAAPDDDDFSKLEPEARVIVVAKDPTPGGKSFSETSEMSARAAEREVEIKILNVLGVVKSTWYRLTGKAKPQPYQVTITVEPHPEWEKEYSHKDFPMEVMLGRNPAKHVWMPRKGAGSSWADKP